MHIGSGEKFFFSALTIVSCVDLVVGRDVGCCKIWTSWRQSESCMSRFICLINLNEAKSGVLTVISVGIVMLIVRYVLRG